MPETDPFITTFTGKQFYFNQLHTAIFDVIDIAHALSQLCRYNGHCSQFYSVAEHCCLIHDWIRQEYRHDIHPGHQKIIKDHMRAGLFHDAVEAYTGDIVGPLLSLFPDFHQYSQQIEQKIAIDFQLEYPFPSIVKEADKRILVDEMSYLFTKDAIPWDKLTKTKLGVQIQCWKPEQAKQEFQTRAECSGYS